ncbi:MAG: GIY-YIG nuclease family protein [candidate division NC10 bacterium]|nr:GIY-YIG nuclease family protein [candidate division NC10 bacterium]
MHYVYLLRSIPHPDRRYIGSTKDLKRRISEHNAGKGEHTHKYRPWRLVTYAAFADTRRAQEFERYLKTGSGQAFANRRLW